MVALFKQFIHHDVIMSIRLDQFLNKNENKSTAKCNIAILLHRSIAKSIIITLLNNNI